MLAEYETVSRETEERLHAYMAVLKKWNERINLVSPKDMDNLWERHILDSLQLVPLVKGRERFVDMGSGGGFPGIVLGIAANIPGVLIESDQRKSAFLREAARITGAPLTVLPCRLDSAEVAPAPVVTARALAPLDKLLTWARPLLEPGGVGLFLKGRQAEQEIEEAARTWRFDVRSWPSKTSPDGVILEVSNFNRAEG
ncbi:16S rRNA (guanine(527)-N(7))-methyltransferase RsmG [Acetobacter fabarum]|jgi:16S rRNA (guanine527-N7)-methyltransferase|uniref:Ribosomal RNA small subunit methyltransferase G n=1 Tax=Acetobacter lovaniensis TaxID=104100 RepID=A0A841QHW8_9PROT|nr:MULTISPECIES: 16S rRNA (guanine(527)-N(7))-methyltransferase RsmG [Acetobacter]MDN6713721.1 16S rRNA (guanine(527)-N(7))-methyltransferase RsmG [Acetobacter sp.]MBB6457612.1 16S rRNA (guanine527-N7)-methyltransferase [Acetobacter lovaniensis]MCH4025383.1 16S rRNA (guanine(527)-N(7))-methyltransferase RsmG [Acetobacter fabarum]MCH4086757.1 16S rRNA (guanine(527)-N(7))-methyltransferase RsmG [Acetobacter fabarum]MCH4128199.1 16S rRNA (guanine(527)-N(7))-methyltransferase RsmG [Acetobacter fab